jgi:hypothetical protein
MTGTHFPGLRPADTAIYDAHADHIFEQMKPFARSEWRMLGVTWDPAMIKRWGEGQRGNRGGAARISIAMIGCTTEVERHRQAGAKMEFLEYAAYAKRPDIGAFLSERWQDHLNAVIAHELAHSIQFQLRKQPVAKQRVIREHLLLDLRQAHGPGFRKIYRRLRDEFVNGNLEAENGLREAPLMLEQRPQLLGVAITIAA